MTSCDVMKITDVYIHTTNGHVCTHSQLQTLIQSGDVDFTACKSWQDLVVNSHTYTHNTWFHTVQGKLWGEKGLANLVNWMPFSSIFYPV